MEIKMIEEDGSTKALNKFLALGPTEETNEQLYVCFLYQALDGGHFAPACVDDLEAAKSYAEALIKEHGEDYNLNRLNKVVRELIINDEKPELLRDGA